MAKKSPDQSVTMQRASSLVVDHRFGRPVYSANPSVSDDIGRQKAVQIGDGIQRGYIVDHSTAEMRIGGATFVEVQKVDDEKFVKLFLAGVRGQHNLTKSGIMMFGVVYELMQRHPNTDRIDLVFYTVSNVNPSFTERTYQRGLSELLRNQFIFDSPVPGSYFVNVTFMYNGDRLNLVKRYERERRTPALATSGQLSLLQAETERA